MRQSIMILAILTILGIGLVGSPQGWAENCFSCGAVCTGCCPDGGGCVYDILHDSCFITCNPPAGPSDPKPLPYKPPPDCSFDENGDWVCPPFSDGLAASNTVTLSADDISLETALNAVTVSTGVPVIAPSVKHRLVSIHVQGEPREEFINEIARQVDAVPVVRGGIRSIELVLKSQLAKRTFSLKLGEKTSPFTANFKDLDVVDAARFLANSVQIDIVLPPSFSGRVSGNFDQATWKDVLQAVVDATDTGGRIQVSPNGLVRILP